MDIEKGNHCDLGRNIELNIVSQPDQHRIPVASCFKCKRLNGIVPEKMERGRSQIQLNQMRETRAEPHPYRDVWGGSGNSRTSKSSENRKGARLCRRPSCFGCSV